ncbi:MAG: hypothetical protein HKP57_06390 [Halobacteria archaeon]|nr:hypothetical protein [Halobacteria archaeon]
MLKPQIVFTFLALLLAATSAHAGFSYKSYDSGSSIIAAVEIEDKGIYNLVISVKFSNEPYDRKPYTGDPYEALIRRLSTEWRGVALKEVLKKNKYKLSDLSRIESTVNTAIQELIKRSKNKHGINAKTEVVYSISSIYLVDTGD